MLCSSIVIAGINNGFTCVDIFIDDTCDGMEDCDQQPCLEYRHDRVVRLCRDEGNVYDTCSYHSSAPYGIDAYSSSVGCETLVASKPCEHCDANYWESRRIGYVECD